MRRERRRSGTAVSGLALKQPRSARSSWTALRSGEDLPIDPGASEWGSLARVRRSVRNRSLQRRIAPGGPNSGSCCGIACGRASTKGRWTTASGTAAGRTTPDFGSSDAVAKVEVSMATPRARSGPQRRARRAERPAHDVLDRRGVVELAPAARSRGDGVARQRRRGQAQQRRRAAVAARRRGAAQGSGDEDGTRRHGGLSGRASLTTRCSVARVTTAAQRTCQATSRDRRHARRGAPLGKLSAR